MKTKNIILNYSLIIMSFVLLLNSGCDMNKHHKAQAETKVYTTLDRTIVPDVVPVMPTVKLDDPANFEKYGYGKWHYGPGLPCQKRVDLMPKGYADKNVTQAADLITFFTMSDIHLTDKESPAQAIFFAPFAGSNGISVYSPLMLYTTQVLNAAVKTINMLNKKNRFDFGIALGDMANSTQYNELRWFIDILDGKDINPDSGEKDDPIPGPDNDYQDKYKAEGLDKSIPWYAAIGNHDHFWLGSKPVNDRVRQSMVGENILQLGNIFTDPKAMEQSEFSVGTLDGSTPYGTIIGCGVVAEMKAKGIAIPNIAADPNRRSLTKEEWVSEFSKTSSLPAGHGFVQQDPKNSFGACYSFEPKAGLPLKVIVLDNTMDEKDTPYEEGIYGHGELTNGRYEWLMSQLNAGQQEGKLMIIAAHVPIGVQENSPMDWKPAPGYKNQKDLISQLQAFPNLILWISGHRHLNNITAFPSSDPAHPENSFWEVETKSLREFPQQFRTFNIVRNSDNSISIITINVDPDVSEGSLPWISRSYAIASAQIYGLNEGPLPTGSVSYNAELVKQLTPEMQKKIQNIGIPVKNK